jgi:hypothetical protein
MLTRSPDPPGTTRDPRSGRKAEHEHERRKHEHRKAAPRKRETLKPGKDRTMSNEQALTAYAPDNGWDDDGWQDAAREAEQRLLRGTLLRFADWR